MSNKRDNFLVKTEEGIKLSQELHERAKNMNTKFASEIDNFITQSKTLFSNLTIVDEFVQSSKIFDDLGQRVGNNYEIKLKETIKEAILHKGFSFVEALQPCVAFYNTFEFYRKKVY